MSSTSDRCTDAVREQIRAYARACVAEAPPLTAAQEHKISLLLRQSAHHSEETTSGGRITKAA